MMLSVGVGGAPLCEVVSYDSSYSDSIKAVLFTV